MKPNGISGSAIFWKVSKYLCEYRKMTLFDPKSSQIFVYGKFRPVENLSKNIIFAETHLKAKKGEEEERSKQVQKLVQFKKQSQEYFPDNPVIIAGDFNDVPESDSIKNVMENDFIDFWSMKDIKFENEE